MDVKREELCKVEPITALHDVQSFNRTLENVLLQDGALGTDVKRSAMCSQHHSCSCECRVGDVTNFITQEIKIESDVADVSKDEIKLFLAEETKIACK